MSEKKKNIQRTWKKNNHLQPFCSVHYCMQMQPHVYDLRESHYQNYEKKGRKTSRFCEGFSPFSFESVVGVEKSNFFKVPKKFFFAAEKIRLAKSAQGNLDQ